MFIYTPGDIAVTQVFGFDGKATSVSTWVIYGAIFAYSLVATMFPIDTIVGRIYPIFGGILLFSAIGVFVGLFAKGYPMINIWDAAWPPLLYQMIDGAQTSFSYTDYFQAKHFFPTFFITVACGLLSGFRSTQTAIITRTMKTERQDRTTFYYMMIVEGIIVLPITSGDAALRGLRMAIAESFHIDQSSIRKRLTLSAAIFVLVATILIFAKMNADGIQILWRYFAWFNQSPVLFAFLAITVWMYENGKARFAWMPLIPSAFYTFITDTFIMNAPIGFHLPWGAAYTIGITLALVYAVVLLWYGRKRASRLTAYSNHSVSFTNSFDDNNDGDDKGAA